MWFDLFFSSSLPEVFCKKGVLKNVAKLIGKHLYQSLVFNIIAALSHQRRSIKKMFLKIWQNNRKTPVTEFVFNKIAGIKV